MGRRRRSPRNTASSSSSEDISASSEASLNAILLQASSAISDQIISSRIKPKTRVDYGRTAKYIANVFIEDLKIAGSNN